MDDKDLEAIGNLLDKKLDEGLRPIKNQLDTNTSATVRIEQKIDSALELRQDVSEIRSQVKNHEARIANVEKI
ncbi:MAG TPA: hypothetical protein VLE47_01550 [Candidatus Saccharimonadales bacterium]|nr:hypothetical protein [Candidatus Saccharimonadales bacterium]